MFNYEKIANACKELTVGEIYEYKQIVDFVHQATGIKEHSIVPSDYCYNKTNIGADGPRFIKWPRLFKSEEEKLYRYLEEGYSYNGGVKYAVSNNEYGTWIDGVFKEIL